MSIATKCTCFQCPSGYCNHDGNGKCKHTRFQDNIEEEKLNQQVEIIEFIKVEHGYHYGIVSDCVDLAHQSTCKRSRCGAIIVSECGTMTIGEGYNSQPCNVDAECFKDSLPANFKSDKTCCIHAEQRAIVNALKNFPDKVNGSTLYFVRLDEKGQPKPSGEPYCTICSKMALDVGISRFVLFHKNSEDTGWLKSYEANYYNELSFQYGK